MDTTTPTAFFWDVAAPFLVEDGVTKGTMMGFPCLRIDGGFFASADYRTGDLVVKLPAERVQALIDAGDGDAFAPNGRRFREWVLVKERNATLWTALIAEAKNFVGKDA